MPIQPQIHTQQLVQPLQKNRRRTLDFIVSGIARSGTTALCRMLNLHQHIYCSNEYFPMDYDYSRINVPACFLEKVAENETLNTQTSRTHFLAKSSSSEIMVYGSKFPGYHSILNRVNHHNPGLKNLFIYRKPQDFVPSWEKRAENPVAWHRGQLGIFGVFELFVLLYRLVETEYELRIINYDDLFFNDESLSCEILAYIADGYRDDAFSTKFTDEIFARSEIKEKERAISSLYEEIFSAHHIDTLNGIMLRHSFADKNRYTGALKEYLADYGEAFLAAFPHYVADFGADAREFYDLWLPLRKCITAGWDNDAHRLYNMLPEGLANHR